jgi:hypothetical protein
LDVYLKFLQTGPTIPYRRGQGLIKHSIAVGELIDHINFFLGTPIFRNTMRHILRGIRALQSVDGIPVDSNWVLADPNLIDEYGYG